jgi:hypothetical protein
MVRLLRPIGIDRVDKLDAAPIDELIAVTGSSQGNESPSRSAP